MELMRGYAIRNHVIRNKFYSKRKNTKKYLKLTFKLFGEEYGRNILIDALLRLIENRSFMLNVKYLNNYKKNLSRKVKSRLSKIPF